MPKPNVRNMAYIRGKDPKLYETLMDILQGMQNTSDQTNANPNGPVAAPPQISAIHAIPLAPGIHKVQIVDNNPVRRGIIYHFEFSTTPNFAPGTTILSQSGPSKDHIVDLGAGDIFWSGYSQYATSDPSPPLYAGAGVDAGGAARTADILGAGSGTESNVQPQPGAGFGFTADRSPRLPK